MAKRVRRARTFATLFSVLSAFACSQVLGIEEARVDPSLNATGGTTTSSSGGQGGSSVNAGGSMGAAPATGGNAGMTGQSGGTSGNASSGGVNTGGNDEGGEAGFGGSEGGSAGAGGAAGAGGNGSGSLCDQYCDVITQYCTTTSLQYKDREQCVKVCDLLPQGELASLEDSNTVSCRLRYAGKARYAGGTELAAYCRQAGPGGDGRCGSDCEGFCSITMATCNQADTAPYYFSSAVSCLSTCMSLPDIPYTYGDVTVADGNSAQCRLFHVISAVMADAEEHCEHAMGLTLCEASQ